LPELLSHFDTSADLVRFFGAESLTGTYDHGSDDGSPSVMVRMFWDSFVVVGARPEPSIGSPLDAPRVV
jgi:hypothetical protein